MAPKGAGAALDPNAWAPDVGAGVEPKFSGGAGVDPNAEGGFGADVDPNEGAEPPLGALPPKLKPVLGVGAAAAGAEPKGFASIEAGAGVELPNAGAGAFPNMGAGGGALEGAALLPPNMGAGALSFVESDPNLRAAELEPSLAEGCPPKRKPVDSDDDPPKLNPLDAGAGAEGVSVLPPNAAAEFSLDGWDPNVVGAAGAGVLPKLNEGAGAADESPSSRPRRRLLLSSFDESLLGMLPNAGTIVLASDDEEPPKLKDGAGAASEAGPGALPKLKPVDALSVPLLPKLNVGWL